MGVVLFQILQWILRIILFLLLFIVILVTIILVVPVRYKVEGEFLEKKPGVRGKITWFFYLIYIKFAYEEEFNIMLRVLGFKVFDSGKENEPKKVKKDSERADNIEKVSNAENTVNETAEKANDTVETGIAGKTDTKSAEEEYPTSEDVKLEKQENEYSLTDWEKEIEAEAKEEADVAEWLIQKQTSASESKEETVVEERKKTLFDKIEDIKLKIQDILQKVKDIIAKIQEGKLKAEYYLELWNRKETQVTFNRAKRKLGKMVKAILPRKWNVIGEIGFSDPATTGKLMGVLGVMYPIIGSHVQIVPDFEEEIMSIQGNVKGHIRLGNLLYQMVSLILNIHCFKFIKLVLDELSGSKKSNKQNNSKKNKKET